jgi:hypothetical protein
MSGHQLTRGQRLKSQLNKAAAIAILASPSLALAAKKPSPPPPPPTPPGIPPAPQPAPLNAAPNVHWFAAWDQNTAPAAADFFATPSVFNTVPSVIAAVTAFNGSAAVPTPLGVKVEQALVPAAANVLFNSPFQPGNKQLSYVFADIEAGTPLSGAPDVAGRVLQVRT